MKMVFGEFTLDMQARQLWRGSTVVALEPKMYQLLEILIKRQPAVISNEELDTLLWPHVFVARTSLTRLVSALRSILGDEARDAQIIRTAYKTGYAFCAKAIVVETPSPAPQVAQRNAASVVQLVWNDREILLAEGEHVAGRGEDCSVVIDASTVSRRHAKIVVRAGSITIEDLESTNGTHVNGVLITGPTPLGHGSKFELGSELLLVRQRNPSALTVRLDSRRLSTGSPCNNRN